MNVAASQAEGRLFAAPTSSHWLFGRAADLWVFTGSALLSLALLALGGALGMLDGDLPGWGWVLLVLGVDVAHVWSTLFRVYLDPEERRQRRVLYVAVPAACYAAGIMAHAISASLFWRVLAYFAVYHFVRQQAGWLALYRRKAQEQGGLDSYLDRAAIYAATLYPLLYWHAHLPRAFDWFVPGDFVVGLAVAVSDELWPVYLAVMCLFVLRQVQRTLTGQAVNVGKVLLVLSTWACWHLGIITFNSDYAFAVTNVLIHGIPYLALTYRHARVRGLALEHGLLASVPRLGLRVFVPLVLVMAAAEEGLWHSLVWQAATDPLWLTFLVPLLALPQATHYALDGFIWRVRPHNRVLMDELGG